MSNETPSRATKDKKYQLITYLLEKGLTLDEIIVLKKNEAPDLFPEDRADLMEALERYVSRNKNKIKNSNLFFPGQKGQLASKASTTFQLYHYLVEQGRSLSEFGLKIMTKEDELAEKKIAKKNSAVEKVKELLR